MHMERQRRRQWIAEELRAGPVPSQEQLVRIIARRGQRVTQATISRDLQAIGALKGHDGYSLPETIGLKHGGDDNELDALLRRHAVSIVQADSLLVLITAPGHANVVASALDRWPPDQAAGTIAGDDTVFIATPSRTDASRLTTRLLARAGLRKRRRSA